MRPMMQQACRKGMVPISKLNTLPPELLLCIADHLDTASIASASLTCKRLQANLSYVWPSLGKSPFGPPTYGLHLAREPFKRRIAQALRRIRRPEPPTVNTERTALLRLLSPAHYVCRYCLKLKPVACYVPLDKRRYKRHLNCEHSEYYAQAWNTVWDVAIDFHDAHLVLNAHVHGPSAGVPLASLTYRGDWEVRPIGEPTILDALDWFGSTWHGKDDIFPHIKDDQLILQVRRRQLHEPQSRDRYRAIGLGWHPLGVCTHLSHYTSEGVLTSLVDIGLSRLPPTHSGHWTAADIQISPLWRCPDCPTNFCINILDHGDIGVEVVVESWHNLGFCREMGALVGAQHFPIFPTLPLGLTIDDPELRRRDPSLPALMYPKYMLGLPPGSYAGSGLRGSSDVLKGWGVDPSLIETRLKHLESAPYLRQFKQAMDTEHNI